VWFLVIISVCVVVGAGVDVFLLALVWEKSEKPPNGGRVVTVQGAPDDDALGLAYDL